MSRALGPDDLVITGSTLGNPPFADLVAAAAGAGFAGISLWPEYTYARAVAEGRSPADLRAMVADAGLVVNDVEAVICWVGPDDPGPPYYEEPTEALLFETAEAFGARSTNVLLAGAPGVSIDECAAVFAGICDRAAEHELVGTFEFSVRSLIGTLGDAVELVRRSGRANGAVLLDTWHLHYTGGTLADVQALPPGIIRSVQMNDAPEHEPENLPWATRYHRQPPGAGILDLVGTVRALDAIGYDGPLTVEVFNADLLAEDGAAAFARRLGDAMRAIVATARA
jgi:sugar phosphate isomerase/epimerase